jgi:hypothetical protein
MTCPHLEYRTAGEEDPPRAYCEIAERFVQPMRADICNGRYGLEHETHCEIYRAAEDDGS